MEPQKPITNQPPPNEPSKRRRYSDEFKRDAVRLTAEEYHSFWFFRNFSGFSGVQVGFVIGECSS